MCGDSRAKDNTALGACCRCQAKRSSTNPERSTCLQSTTLQLVQPSAPFLPASFDAKRHLVITKPRTRVADFAPRGSATADRSMSACQKATFDGYHDGNAHCAPPDAVAAVSACEPQETQAPGWDHYQCSHAENLERCRDPLVCKQ